MMMMAMMMMMIYDDDDDDDETHDAGDMNQIERLLYRFVFFLS